MDDLVVDDELTASVVDDNSADGATALTVGLADTVEEVTLGNDLETLADVTGLGHGDDGLVLIDVQDAVGLVDRAEHGLDNDGGRRVVDEARLLLQLAGEKVNTQVAVLASLGGDRDTDDLARTTLQDQDVAKADVVAGNGDMLASGLVATALNGTDLTTGGRGVVVVVTHLGLRVLLDSGLRLVNLKSRRSRRLARGIRDSGRRRRDDALRLERLRVGRGQLLRRIRVGRGADDGGSRAGPTTIFSLNEVKLVIKRLFRLGVVRSVDKSRSMRRSRFLDVLVIHKLLRNFFLAVKSGIWKCRSVRSSIFPVDERVVVLVVVMVVMLNGISNRFRLVHRSRSRLLMVCSVTPVRRREDTEGNGNSGVKVQIGDSAGRLFSKAFRST